MTVRRRRTTKEPSRWAITTPPSGRSGTVERVTAAVTPRPGRAHERGDDERSRCAEVGVLAVGVDDHL